MEAKINRSQIMKQAHFIRRELEKTMSEALKHAWLVFKNEQREKEQDAKREAIHAIWKKEADAKREAERQAEHETFVASGLSLHEYTMSQYYGRGSGAYTGD